MKLGIISDTHITKNTDEGQISSLINQLNKIFEDTDKIVHAGDVCERFLLDELEKIAPIICVRGNEDKIKELELFAKFSASRYKIGVIHILPENVDGFVDEHNLNIVIFGHTHIPLIKGTSYNALLLNPGSPTRPKTPPQKPGFLKPVARPSVITLNIDENDVLSTFIVTLKI
ncbi:MAG: metallophosphoesterase family protein [Promethearchaeota archaeon]